MSLPFKILNALNKTSLTLKFVRQRHHSKAVHHLIYHDIGPLVTMRRRQATKHHLHGGRVGEVPARHAGVRMPPVQLGLERDHLRHVRLGDLLVFLGGGGFDGGGVGVGAVLGGGGSLLAACGGGDGCEAAFHDGARGLDLGVAEDSQFVVRAGVELAEFVTVDELGGVAQLKFLIKKRKKMVVTRMSSARCWETLIGNEK